MSWKLVCAYAVSEGVPRRSLWVALVVGTILNVINQGDLLLSGHHLNLAKIALTYVVPYIVGTYGAVSFRLHAAQTQPPQPVAGLGPAIHVLRRGGRKDHSSAASP